MNFKTALVISFVGHCFILTPLGNLWFFPMHRKMENPPIAYYKILPPKIVVEKKVVVEQKTPPAPASAPEKPKAQKSDIVKKVKSVVRGQAPKVPVPSPSMPVPSPKESIIPSSIPGTTLPNTPACVEYYQYIREEIRRFLKRGYTSEYEEGDVNVSFALDQSGGLLRLDIIEAKSSSDPYLHKLAYKSIKNASPFKPFPKGLTQHQISFNLTVVFKKN